MEGYEGLDGIWRWGFLEEGLKDRFLAIGEATGIDHWCL